MARNTTTTAEKKINYIAKSSLLHQLIYYRKKYNNNSWKNYVTLQRVHYFTSQYTIERNTTTTAEIIVLYCKELITSPVNIQYTRNTTTAEKI